MGTAQGHHNKGACKYLYDAGGEYDDWVMTTAFYSAIHYIDSKLFPIEINGCKCRNINEARKQIGTNAHKARRILVAQHLASISHSYNYLSSECENARYNVYVKCRRKAKMALDYLEEIIDFCGK